MASPVLFVIDETGLDFSGMVPEISSYLKNTFPSGKLKKKRRTGIKRKNIVAEENNQDMMKKTSKKIKTDQLKNEKIGKLDHLAQKNKIVLNDSVIVIDDDEDSTALPRDLDEPSSDSDVSVVTIDDDPTIPLIELSDTEDIGICSGSYEGDNSHRNKKRFNKWRRNAQILGQFHSNEDFALGSLPLSSSTPKNSAQELLRSEERNVENKNGMISITLDTQANREQPKNKQKRTVNKAKEQKQGVVESCAPLKDKNNDKQIKALGALRPIIIDGSNVAFGHGRDQFSSKGLKICVDFFKQRGHEVRAFLPQFRRRHPYTKDHHILDSLEKEGHIVYTPSRMIEGHLVVSYDDRFIVQYADQSGGVIVSRDNYRDLLKENPEWKKTISQRLLMYTFVGDLIMFPDDPLGRSGPHLESFLRF